VGTAGAEAAAAGLVQIHSGDKTCATGRQMGTALITGATRGIGAVCAHPAEALDYDFNLSKLERGDVRGG